MQVFWYRISGSEGGYIVAENIIQAEEMIKTELGDVYNTDSLRVGDIDMNKPHCSCVFSYAE